MNYKSEFKIASFQKSIGLQLHYVFDGAAVSQQDGFYGLIDPSSLILNSDFFFPLDQLLYRC